MKSQRIVDGYGDDVVVEIVRDEEILNFRLERKMADRMLHGLRSIHVLQRRVVISHAEFRNAYMAYEISDTQPRMGELTTAVL